MDFRNDQVADEVEKQMKSLVEKGVFNDRVDNSAYNRVYEAFYILIKKERLNIQNLKIK